jgi:hypothetical protein
MIKRGRWPGRVKAIAEHGDRVTELRAAGVSQHEIALTLKISYRTVQRMCSQLKVHKPHNSGVVRHSSPSAAPSATVLSTHGESCVSDTDSGSSGTGDHAAVSA